MDNFTAIMQFFLGNQHVALIVALVFFLPAVVTRIKSGSISIAENKWTILAASSWSIFWVYRLLSPRDAFYQFIDIWFVLPVLLVFTVNCIIWAALGFVNKN